MIWTFNPQIIKEIRKQVFLTQEAFAKRLKMKHPQMISEWEKGKSLPTIRSVLKIANEFQISPGLFFGDVEYIKMTQPVKKKKRWWQW